MAQLKIFGQPDDRTLGQLKRCAEEADFAVLCADSHVGYSQPIGAAIAYEDRISPSGAGYDIGCGNKAARTALKAEDVDVPKVMEEIVQQISFGIGRSSAWRVDHPILDRIQRADFEPQRKLARLARDQLGTVGGGNHYVDLLADEEGLLWVGVHFGSRGFGHKTASGFLALGQGLEFEDRAREGSMDAPPLLFDTRAELGQAYIEAMTLAGDYAYAGRDLVVDKVLGILGTDATEEVHNHHNFCVAGTEKVATPFGWKRISEIGAGDIIYAFDEKKGTVEARVEAAWSSGRKPIHTIATANRRLRVSGDHPILVIENDMAPHPTRPWHTRGVGRYVWKRAQEIRVGDILVCIDGYYRRSGSISEERARFVGAFLGDGWIRHSRPEVSGYGVGLAIGAPDEPHTLRYERLCQALFPQAKWRNNARGAFGLSCSSKAAYVAIQNLGVTGRAREKCVPRLAFLLRRREKLALLSGYVDADGCVANSHTSNHGRVTCVSVSKPLIIDLRELAIGCSLRVTNTRSQLQRSNFGGCIAYSFLVGAESATDLDLWHDQKRAKLRHSPGRPPGLPLKKLGFLQLPEGAFAQKVRSVTISDEEEVYDLSVDHPSHSFICEGIVVHNCWRESHFGAEYWVVRKGCTPAFPEQRGFVGGSMGDISVILEGIDGLEAKEALYSTVHGAGRVMSRRQAAGKRRWMRDKRTGRRYAKTISPGVIDWDQEKRELQKRGIEIRGGGADEAPGVYKRLDDVLDAHSGSIRIRHTLRPLGVAMAGDDVLDPYRD